LYEGDTVSRHNRERRQKGKDRLRIRAAIAEAVHRAVCEETGGDGFGHCMLYAVAGMCLSRSVFHTDAYVPQAGALLIQPDPNDPGGWIAQDVSDGGVAAGEFHAWFARGPEGFTGTGLPVEMVDLSSRHYPRMATDLPTIRDRQTIIDGELAATVVILDDRKPRWLRPEPVPPFLWIDGSRHLEWVRLHVDEQATRALYDILGRNGDFYKRLTARAAKHLSAWAFQ
jgi:hypothetical protein